MKETSQAELDLKGILSSEEPEAVLKVTLDTPLSQNGKTAGYYTRIVRPKEVTTDQCLAFAKDFHTKALNKEATEELTAYLEPDEKSDNTTYQTVNIHSDITHIQWGDMKPSVIGDVEWDIKESNTVYTSILAKYKVSCTDEEGAESIYNVKEFFRVRFLVDTIYLLDYNRNMEQVFDGRESDFDENGIILGIIPKDISYEINKDQTSAAFVQAGELWLYESKKGNLTKVFSMPDQEGRDTRGENDQHAVRVIGIDNKIILRLPFTGIWRAAATKARSASAFIIMMRLKIRLRKRHLLQVRNRLPSQKMSLVRWYIIIRVLPFCTFLQTELYIGSI